MYVILTYDIRVKRVAKTRKVVKKYLHPVQRSVFEGFLSDGKLRLLKNELKNVIHCDEDSVRIYKLQNLQGAELEAIGVYTDSQPICI
ncbi:MAG: CRISPR-associated endonuclease Cas2 [Oscillospiraceae bacterium]|nr:CRISPR-associated endonuclease Cas2 [Oscillospiraceae bacterium]